MSSIFQVVKGAFRDFGDDECAVRAAALAYYTIFALPPLLILLLMAAGMIWDPGQVQRALETQFAGMIGDSAARQVHDMIAAGDRMGGKGGLATIVSIGGLLFGATGAFMQLQGALNRAWEVKPDPEKGGVMRFVTRRLLSLGMVMGLGFLLAVSLAVSALLAAFGDRFGGSLSGPVLMGLNLAISLVVLGLLFAGIFKVLPDAKIAWKDVLLGGLVTAVLFTIGKFAIGLYLGRSNPGNAFGAASALAVILVWTYYAGMIILFGAEFTQAWARRRGDGVRPKPDAVRVVEQEVVVRDAGTIRGPRAPTDGGAAAATARASVAPGETAASGGIAKALLGVPVFMLLFGRRREKKQAGR
ncbi:MAG TPA: YihY/virulence factor BrkB family protein [Gemmatimonadaceae bacterium]